MRVMERRGEPVFGCGGGRGRASGVAAVLRAFAASCVLLAAPHVALTQDAAAEGQGGPLLTASEVSQRIEVTDVESSATAVTGRLLNYSGTALRDVRLVVRSIWLWNNERNPGVDNPGRAGFHTVREEVPAGGNVTFVYPLQPPLPDRADGRFATVVEVVDFVEVGP